MKLINDGKTKRLFALDDERIRIVFKDDVTGSAEGIDPGGNEVVGRIEGKGFAALRQSVYFFSLLARHGVPTHFIEADLSERYIIARRAKWYGLEFIVRYKAAGSFLRRYGRFVEEGAPLDGLVEITLKDDERGDPFISDEIIALLGIMTPDEVAQAKALVRQAAGIIRDDLARMGLELVDIKFECGLVGGQLVLIDDISTDNMRVLRAGTPVDHTEVLRCIDQVTS